MKGNAAELNRKHVKVMDLPSDAQRISNQQTLTSKKYQAPMLSFSATEKILLF